MLERRLRELHQDHVADMIADPSAPEVSRRIRADLAQVDLDLVERLMRGEGLAVQRDGHVEPADVLPWTYACSPEAVACRKEGLELLERGKVAAVMVAGGQGSRLGHDGPKGCVRATPLERKSLFRVFSEQVLALSRRTGRDIPWFIMTSRENDAPTRAFFESNGFFGLNASAVHFFVQGMLPSLSLDGKFLLSSEGGVFLNPDGHGGVFRALRISGCLDLMRDMGIEEIFTFQVDNPLVKVCDPLFIGLHHRRGAQISSKVVRKTSFDEKVGVIVKQGARTCLVEYSDMDDTLRYATAPDGTMLHWAGSIAVHVIDRVFAEHVASRDGALPYHRAVKTIRAMGPDASIVTVDGVKFETFIFDALPLARTSVTLEVLRAEEFAPIKNATGNDSLESSRALQVARHVSWLTSAGVRVADGVAVEISPLFAYDADDLMTKRSSLPDVISRDTYFG